MRTLNKALLAALLMVIGPGAADGANNYYLCSYEIHEDGVPIVRRIEYYAPDLQTAIREFDAFLKQLEAQGKTPRNLGCR